MKIKFLFLCIISSLSFAQIGVNKTNVNVNSAFETGATNQGVLIPRIPVVKNLTDKTFLNLPTETLPDGLLIYCEGGTGSIGSGYYVWQNNQWNYALDLKNIRNRLDITRLYTTSSTGNSPAIVTQFYKNGSNVNPANETIPQINYKDIPSTAKWLAVPETEVDFQVLQTNNSISLTTYGNTQTGPNNYITTVNPRLSRTLGFNIGVFIKTTGANDSTYQLYAVGTFANAAPFSCLVTPFTVSSVINLPQGNYTAKIFIMGRRNFISKNTTDRTDYYLPRNATDSNAGNSGNYTYLTVGGKSPDGGIQGENNGSCTNTDKLTMNTTLNILISEVTPKN